VVQRRPTRLAQRNRLLASPQQAAVAPPSRFENPAGVAEVVGSMLPSWVRPGTVDYRLARRHLINEFQRKRLSRIDVCDAHPELLRAAEHVGHLTDHDCPICEESKLTYVSYVFGARLPAHGRVISTAKEMATLAKAHDELACYVVEVCTCCRWNHLTRTFKSGRLYGR
jgi:Family of unknown function (DUF5318)